MLRVSRFIFLILATATSYTEARSYASSSSSASEENKNKTPLGKRIENGYRSGALTQKEYDELKDKQKEIREFREKMNKDGEVTAEERAEMKKLRDEQRKDIREEMTDNQFRPQMMLDSFTRRIQNGIKTGTLTNAEVTQLNKVVEEATAYYQNALKDDGKLDAEEREGLGALMNSTRIEIRDERQDLQIRELSAEECGALTPEQCAEWRQLRDKRREREANSQ